MTDEIDTEKIMREHSQQTYAEGYICEKCMLAIPGERCLPYRLAVKVADAWNEGLQVGVDACLHVENTTGEYFKQKGCREAREFAKRTPNPYHTTGAEEMTDLNPAAIMAEHEGHHEGCRDFYPGYPVGPRCLPYLLAAKNAALRAQVEAALIILAQWHEDARAGDNPSAAGVATEVEKVLSGPSSTPRIAGLATEPKP